MRQRLTPRWGRPAPQTLADVWSGRNNGFGLIRLLLSFSVIVAHARVIGFRGHGPFYYLWRGQTELGGIAVLGFFAVSGLLITRSANRVTLRQFAWHRFLRIMPGYWACLLVTGLVAGPAVVLYTGSSMHTYFHHPQGPWQYVMANWSLGIGQAGVSGLLAHNPLPGVFNGSLWSLPLEVFCYLAVASLAALGILKRNRALILVMLAAAWLYLISLAVQAGTLQMLLYAPTNTSWNIPLLGYISLDQLLPLMFTFGLGAAAELYRDRLPMHWTLGCVAGVVALLSLTMGGLTTFGLPAFAYFIIWTAVRMPRPLTKVGAKADFSYGLYVYGFVAEQALIACNGTQWGLTPFIALATALALAAAVCSWYLVERPAMLLKHTSPRDLHWPRRNVPGPGLSRKPASVTERVAHPSQVLNADAGAENSSPLR